MITSGKQIEARVMDKHNLERAVNSFLKLSDRISNTKVILLQSKQPRKLTLVSFKCADFSYEVGRHKEVKFGSFGFF